MIYRWFLPTLYTLTFIASIWGVIQAYRYKYGYITNEFRYRSIDYRNNRVGSFVFFLLAILIAFLAFNNGMETQDILLISMIGIMGIKSLLNVGDLRIKVNHKYLINERIFDRIKLDNIARIDITYKYVSIITKTNKGNLKFEHVMIETRREEMVQFLEEKLRFYNITITNALDDDLKEV